MDGIFLILFWAMVFAGFLLYLAVAGYIVDKLEKNMEKKESGIQISKMH